METLKTWELFQCKICYTFLQTRDKIWAHLWTRHSIMNTSTTLNKIQIPDVSKDWEIVTSIKPLSEIWVKVEQENIEQGKKPNKISKGYIKQTLFQCSVCNMDFKDRKSLFAHKFDLGHEPDHEAQSIYTCQYEGCGANFKTSKTLELHKCKHDPRWEGMTVQQRLQFKVDRVVGIGANVYPCPLCPTKVLCRWLLAKHLRIHSKDRRYKCSTCETTYTTEYNLVKHLKSNKCERKLKKMESNRFHCDICKKFLKTEQYLRSHQSTFHGISQNKVRDYTCLFCGYVASWPSHLEEHNRTHTGERPFECQGCNTSFSAKHNLIRHMRSRCKVLKSSGIVAVPEKIIRKPAIGAKAKVKVNVKVNVQDPLHLEKCPHCPQTFRLQKHLRAHIKGHGNNFFCTECGVGEDVGFIRLNQLSRHLSIAHGRRGITAKVKGDVKDPLGHEKCPHCPQTFCHKRLLTAHIKVHGKDFLCTECEDVGFKYLTPLSNHYRIVHGRNEWGLGCHICNVMLCSDESMKEHYSNVHGLTEMKEVVRVATKKVPFDIEDDDLDHKPLDLDQIPFPSVDGGLNEKDKSSKGQLFKSDYDQDTTFDTDLVTPIIVKYEDEF